MAIGKRGSIVSFALVASIASLFSPGCGKNDSTEASGKDHCGNGVVDANEPCDPSASAPGCPTDYTCTASCVCSANSGSGGGGGRGLGGNGGVAGAGLGGEAGSGIGGVAGSASGGAAGSGSGGAAGSASGGAAGSGTGGVAGSGTGGTGNPDPKMGIVHTDYLATSPTASVAAEIWTAAQMTSPALEATVKSYIDGELLIYQAFNTPVGTCKSATLPTVPANLPYSNGSWTSITLQSGTTIESTLSAAGFGTYAGSMPSSVATPLLDVKMNGNPARLVPLAIPTFSPTFSPSSPSGNNWNTNTAPLTWATPPAPPAGASQLLSVEFFPGDNSLVVCNLNPSAQTFDAANVALPTAGVARVVLRRVVQKGTSAEPLLFVSTINRVYNFTNPP